MDNIYDPEALKKAVSRGGLSDLKFACSFVERLCGTVERRGNEEVLPEGFTAYRARNDYVEEIDEEAGQYFTFPLAEDEMGAPPANKTGLGRFNTPNTPVLYLSTTREVALAECRALPSDTCSVGVFKCLRDVRIAKFLPEKGVPIGWLNEEAGIREMEDWLLFQMAQFLARRVQGVERETHYRTCNLVASALKERGFDGLAYRTSFWSSMWQGDEDDHDVEQIRSANIVLFDPKIAVFETSHLFQINWKRPIAERAG